MPEEKKVPAEVINTLTEEILKEMGPLRKKLMYENKEQEDEFTHRVVAMFGALMLLVEQQVAFMMKNGYSAEHLEKLEKTFIDSFVLVDSETLEIIKGGEDIEFKN